MLSTTLLQWGDSPYNCNSYSLRIARIRWILEIRRQLKILARRPTAVDVPLPWLDLVGPGPWMSPLDGRQLQ